MCPTRHTVQRKAILKKILTAIVERYKAQDTWKNDTVFEKESFDLLQNILEEAGELPARVPYEDLVVTDFARAAVKE